jgi:hypothetical protein
VYGDLRASGVDCVLLSESQPEPCIQSAEPAGAVYTGLEWTLVFQPDRSFEGARTKAWWLVRFRSFGKRDSRYSNLPAAVKAVLEKHNPALLKEREEKPRREQAVKDASNVEAQALSDLWKGIGDAIGAPLRLESWDKQVGPNSGFQVGRMEDRIRFFKARYDPSKVAHGVEVRIDLAPGVSPETVAKVFKAVEAAMKDEPR